VLLILEGCAYRYKVLPDGHRQILAYLLPGDLSDVEFGEDTRADHSVAALIETVVARIPLSQIVAVQVQYPNIQRAFSLILGAERSILRHWLLNVGQRSAVQRVSHFLCEFSSRMIAHGQIEAGQSIRLPLSQAVLADTTGVTTVHVNRVLQQLRRDGLIALRRQQLTILDPVRLARLAEFNEGYLFKERHSS
jgi:CRP-like cAMP-binding protein